MLVSPGSRAWYSGMMPGLIAGRFNAADCAIDLQPLCEATGLQLIESSVAAVSAAARQVILTSGQRLAYQVLSVNTGSQPPAPLSDGSIDMVPAKPFPVFHARWQAWQQNPPRRLVVLGGGAAAFELSLALKKSLSGTEVLLICAVDLLSGYARGLQKRAQSLLQQRGVGLQQNIRVSSLASGFICDGERRVCEADALVLATGAAPLVPTLNWATEACRDWASCDNEWLAAVDCSTIAAFCCVTWSIWFTAVLTSARPMACSWAEAAIYDTRPSISATRSTIRCRASPV